jgi:hypothetical protein
MSRWPRTAAIAFTASLVVAVSPVATLGQDASPASPEATTFPPLAQAGALLSQQQICDWSGGTLDGSSCSLPTEFLTDPDLVEVFGSELEMFVVQAAGPPEALSEPAPESGPVISGITFAPSVEINGGISKWLDRQQKRKGNSIAKGKATKWNKLDSVGLVSVHLDQPINARRLSGEGVLMTRLQDGERIFDAGYEDRKPVLTGANGRNAAGLVIHRGDRIDFFIPNGLDGPLTANLVLINGEGLAGAQMVSGPGGPAAGIPTQAYAPALVCGSAIAGVDPASTEDGVRFGLTSMSYTLETPFIPDDIGDVQPTFNLVLSPSGSRAGESLEDVVVEVMPSSDGVRRAITLDVDLTAEAFAGPTGYHLGEIPYTLTGMSATLEPGSSALGFDPDAARALLEEAGWTDADGDGVLERDFADAAGEMNRLTSGGFTETPVHWGSFACGTDAHWASVQDACRLPLDGQYLLDVAALLGESPDLLFAQPGSFAEGFTGCTLFGEQDVFVGTWLLEDSFDQAPGYDPAVLSPFVSEPSLLCDVSSEAPTGQGLQQVGSCSEPPFEIFYDKSRGFSTYFAFAGQNLDTDVISGQIIPQIVDPDLDGDGTTDRFDADIDGDGLLDDVDPDDDGDLVSDPSDWAPTDPDLYTSPNAYADLLESLEAN